MHSQAAPNFLLNAIVTLHPDMMLSYGIVLHEQASGFCTATSLLEAVTRRSEAFLFLAEGAVSPPLH